MMVELVKIGMTCGLMVLPCALAMMITDDLMRFENSKVFYIAFYCLMFFGVMAIANLITAAFIGIWTIL